MHIPRLWTAAPTVFLFLFLGGSPTQASDEKPWSPSGEPPAAGLSIQHGPAPDSSTPSVRIDAVVVNPYRSANVGTEVGGVIERFNFEEGDFIEEGRVVVELVQRRYLLLVQRAQERLGALEVALKRAGQEYQLRKELVDLDATTRQEIIKAESEAEIARYRAAEAKRELDLTVFDLNACKVKAPFSGYLAVRYKQPDETVDRLEKIFAIVDSSKVHAVANLPETLISEFRKGTEAVFVYGPEKRFRGTVDRIGKLIDPKSRTKRVYLLIDNSGNELEVGMTGTLYLAK